MIQQRNTTNMAWHVIHIVLHHATFMREERRGEGARYSTWDGEATHTPMIHEGPVSIHSPLPSCQSVSVNSVLYVVSSAASRTRLRPNSMGPWKYLIIFIHYVLDLLFLYSSCIHYHNHHHHLYHHQTFTLIPISHITKYYQSPNLHLLTTKTVTGKWNKKVPSPSSKTSPKDYQFSQTVVTSSPPHSPPGVFLITSTSITRWHHHTACLPGEKVIILVKLHILYLYVYIWTILNNNFPWRKYYS